MNLPDGLRDRLEARGYERTMENTSRIVFVRENALPGINLRIEAKVTRGLPSYEVSAVVFVADRFIEVRESGLAEEQLLSPSLDRREDFLLAGALPIAERLRLFVPKEES